MSSGVSRVLSQSSKRIEQFAPELEKIISPSEPIQDWPRDSAGPGTSRRTGWTDGRNLPSPCAPGRPSKCSNPLSGPRDS